VVSIECVFIMNVSLLLLLIIIIIIIHISPVVCAYHIRVLLVGRANTVEAICAKTIRRRHICCAHAYRNRSLWLPSNRPSCRCKQEMITERLVGEREIRGDYWREQ